MVNGLGGPEPHGAHVADAEEEVLQPEAVVLLIGHARRASEIFGPAAHSRPLLGRLLLIGESKVVREQKRRLVLTGRGG